MKNKIDYWLDTLSPSLLFITGFFSLFFVYFSWMLGIYIIFLFLFILATYFVFFKENFRSEELKLDEVIVKQYEEYERLFSLGQEAMVLLVGDDLYAGNSLFEDLIGKSVSTIRSREWLKLIHAEDLLPFIDWVHLGNHNLDSSILLRFFNHSTGEIIWVKARKISVPTTGTKNAFIVSFRDVSEQKIYQEKALESQIQVYTLIDFAPIAVIIFDSQGKPEYINNFGQNLLGYSRLDITQMGLAKIIAGEKYSSFILQWESFLREGKDSFLASTTLISKNLTSLEVMLSCVAVKNLEDKITSYFLTIVDLTETQKLISKNQFFVGLLNNSDCISIVDPKGIVVDANSLFLEKVCNESGEVIGSSYNKIFFGKNGLPEALLDLKKDDIFRDEVFHQSSERNVWLDRTFIPYFTDNKLEHFYVIHRDITQRVQQEIEIKRNNNVLKFITSSQNEFISSSHDKASFKNILEKISMLKETAISLIIDVEYDEAIKFSILYSYKNGLYADDSESLTQDELLETIKSDNLFGNSPLFESPMLVNNLNDDFGPFDEKLSIEKIQNLVSFPIKRNQKVIGLLVLVNSRNKPIESDIFLFEPVITSLATMVFAYKEVESRNLVEFENSKLQETISNQLQQLEQILISSPDTYIMFSLNGILQFISRKTINFLTPGKVFVEGMSLYDLQINNYEHGQLFVELFEKTKVGNNSQIVINDNDANRNYQVEFIGIKGSNSEIISVLCAVRDITEQKMYESELSIARDSALLASESKSEYLSSLYQELESPLSTLMVLIETYEAQQLTNEKNVFLASFKKAASEINGHVERFFGLTVSPNTLSQQLNTKSNVNSLLKICFEDFNEVLNEKQVSINYQDTDRVFEVYGTSYDIGKLVKVIFEFLFESVHNLELNCRIDDAINGGVCLRFSLPVESISKMNLRYLQFNEIVDGSRLSLKTLNLKKELIEKNARFVFSEADDKLNLEFIFDDSKIYTTSNSRNSKEVSAVNFVVDHSQHLTEGLSKLSDSFTGKMKAIVFDHRDDYANTLIKYLNMKHVDVLCVESIDECLEKIQKNTYDLAFIDISYSLPHIDELFMAIENSMVLKVIASIPINMQTSIRKNDLSAKIEFIPRPFKKSDILNIIR